MNTTWRLDQNNKIGDWVEKIQRIEKGLDIYSVVQNLADPGTSTSPPLSERRTHERARTHAYARVCFYSAVAEQTVLQQNGNGGPVCHTV